MTRSDDLAAPHFNVRVSRGRIKLKRTLKLLLGAASWPLLAWHPRSGIRVLFYHRVNPFPFERLGPVSREISITPVAFEAQLAWLRRKAYRSATPQEMEAVLTGKGTAPPKTVVITFDDGFEDNYLWAHPLLLKYDFQGVFFITTDYVGADHGPEWTVGDQPGLGRFLRWEQIKEMHDAGALIASHTCSHRPLTELDDRELARELGASRSALAAHIGGDVRWFAYPAGDQNPRVRAATAAAGYSLAFTTVPGWTRAGTSALAMPRVEISASDSPLIFRMKIAGLLDWTRLKEAAAFRRAMGWLNGILIRTLTRE